MDIESLSLAEVFRFASVVAISMVHIFAAACSYYMEKRHRRLPMFALIFTLLAWCTLDLGFSDVGAWTVFPIPSCRCTIAEWVHWTSVVHLHKTIDQSTRESEFEMVSLRYIWHGT